jgi:hypothetical protein
MSLPVRGGELLSKKRILRAVHGRMTFAARMRSCCAGIAVRRPVPYLGRKGPSFVASGLSEPGRTATLPGVQLSFTRTVIGPIPGRQGMSEAVTTVRIKESSPRFLARIIGVFYLLTVLTGLFAEIFVSDRLVVSGDAAATVYYPLFFPSASSG